MLTRDKINSLFVGNGSDHEKPRHTGELDILINSCEVNAERLVIAIKVPQVLKCISS
jgi:hypothetical protein